MARWVRLRSPAYFYPRPPRGGRHFALSGGRILADISIHALREEGDRPSFSGVSGGGNFYPRPPRGGRQTSGTKTSTPAGFLSTPSARRATTLLQADSSKASNFYPRPPRGGRRTTPSCTSERNHFYPRPPRGGRLLRLRQSSGVVVISIHALREEGDYDALPTLSTAWMISIHALREEGDSRMQAQTAARLDFYPRPPRGGRLKQDGSELVRDRFLSTPSARRATRGRVVLRLHSSISIHALREEGDRTVCGSELAF